jgi:hypothetical protein
MTYFISRVLNHWSGISKAVYNLNDYIAKRHLTGSVKWEFSYRKHVHDLPTR